MIIKSFFFKVCLFTTICLNAAFLYSADVPFAFNGIELGSEFEAITNDVRFTCELTNSDVADKTCRLKTKFAEEVTISGVPIISLKLYYFQDRLSSIVIVSPETYYNAVQHTLREMHGQPDTQRVETYVTQSYNLFKGKVYVWENSIAMIDAVQYFSNTYKSALVYRLGSQIDELNRTN